MQSSNADEWKRVYLASYPRSGNHWVRYLVEEATNIATSSVVADSGRGSVNDDPHLKKTFPWGGYCCRHGYNGTRSYPTKNDPVLIKTHFPTAPKRGINYKKRIGSIRIVRHPIDTFYSRYVLHKRSNAKEIIPRATVEDFIKSWREFQIYWNKQPDTITFRYEDLHAKPIFVLNKMLKAMKYSVSLTDVERAIHKYPPQGIILKHINHFKKEDLELMALELKDLLDQFGYTIPLTGENLL
jgi:hypothetical protein